eukprot:3056465-Amphidinium_carterae.1
MLSGHDFALGCLCLCACVWGMHGRPLTLIAGVQKGGTSSLSSWLLQRFPGHFSVPHKGCQHLGANESRFFTPCKFPCAVEDIPFPMQHSCGLAAFDACFQAEGMALEKSPDFIFWPHMAKAVEPWLAHAKTRVVLLLRDPVTRLLSDFGQTLLKLVPFGVHKGDH